MHFLGGSVRLDVSNYAVEGLQKIPEACGAAEGAKQSVLPISRVTVVSICLFTARTEEFIKCTTMSNAGFPLSLCHAFERLLCNSLSSPCVLSPFGLLTEKFALAGS